MQLLSIKLKNRLNYFNPFPLIQSFFQSEIREEILKGIDIRLLYFDGELINLENSRVEKIAFKPQAIADAAKRLISYTIQNSALDKKELKKKLDKSSIALFLPLTNFIYTQYSMLGVDAKNIHAALSYQQDEFLPASSDDLELTVKQLKQENNFALWFSAKKAEDFYLAFQQQGLTLASILPSLSLLLSKDESTIRESSKDYLAQYSFSEYGLLKIGHIAVQDLDIEAFKKEWESSFGAVDNSTQCINSKTSWLDYLIDSRYAENYKKSQYAYFPKQIKTQFKSRGYLRNSRVIGLLAFILIFLLALPFVENERKYFREQQKYQKYFDLAKDVREKRSKVLSNEEYWALYLNYPQVDVLTIISRLNEIIPIDSWISSFQIKNGYIEVEGYSPNPTSILELISAQEDFDEVAFNKNTQAERGKTKERFGITFHIKGVNIDDYEKQYFNAKQ